jgi:hypothetical protein
MLYLFLISLFQREYPRNEGEGLFFEMFMYLTFSKKNEKRGLEFSIFLRLRLEIRKQISLVFILKLI